MAKREQRQLNRKRKIEAFLSLVGIKEPAENKIVGDVTERSNTDRNNGKGDSTVKQPPACNKPVLSREELVQLRAQLVQRKKLRQLRSQFYLRGLYFYQEEETQRNAVDITSANRSLSNAELQQLLLFTFEGGCAYQKPQWCVLNNWHRLSHCLCIVVDGADLSDFSGFGTDAFPYTAQEFALPEHAVKLVPTLPGNTLADELLHVPKGLVEFNKVQKRMYYDQMLRQTISKLSNSRSEPLAADDAGSSKDEEVSKTKLLLSAPAMIVEHFPSPNFHTRKTSTNATVTTVTATQNTSDGGRTNRRSISATLGVLSRQVQQPQQSYVPTKDSYTGVSDSSPMFAVDCEMCLTTARRNELTRVSLVDENLNVLYDSYVKPHNKIVHYLTQYSGVTAGHMVDCTTRLSDVQEKFRELLPPDAILIGHSLNFDLHALNMLHPYVIDTSCIFNLTGTQHRKSKLQHLAQVLLNQSIQCGGKQGHSSVEDARATMELVKLKLARNSQIFGDTRLGYQYVHPANETENSTVEPESSTDGKVDLPDITVKIEARVIDVDEKISFSEISTTTTAVTSTRSKRKLTEDDVADVGETTETVLKKPAIDTDTAANMSARSTRRSGTALQHHMLRDWCTPITSHFVEHKTNAALVLQTDSYERFLKLSRRTSTPDLADMMKPSSSNKATVKLARESLLNSTSFVFAELRALPPPADEKAEDDSFARARRTKQLHKVDRCIRQIMEAVQDNALVCVVFQRRQSASDSSESLTLEDKLGLALCKVTNLSLQPSATNQS